MSDDLRHIRELLERRDFATALAASQSLLAQAPESRDALYLAAVALRYLQRIPEALGTLARLEALHPDYPRLFQERGHCYVALREAEPAIAAFERALSLNSALQASWRSLAVLYGMVGRVSAAKAAEAALSKLATMPPEILTAWSLFADGETQAAEALVRRFLLEHGDHVEGMRLLAQIGVKLDILDDAELLLEAVTRLAPDYHDARYDYATVLLKRHKHVAAREQMEQLLEVDPAQRAWRTTYATVCMGCGDHARALPIYREVLRETPRDPEILLSIGHALKTGGNTASAIEAYRAAAAARPNFGDAYWSLANLKTYRFSDAELERMRSEEAAGTTPPVDRYHLCFALGKALEDRAQYPESWQYYERGNALKKLECRYRPTITETNTRLQQAICTSEFFAERSGFGCASCAPIFVVGLPRAGSTLIEQILASHSQVEGTMELADIARMVQGLQGRESVPGEPHYPRVLRELSAEQCRALGEQYLTDTRVYRTGRPRFIDKMPNNFRHLGLIHLILPNARIVDARREALPCCFSNFKQLFASGQQFTYGLEDIGRYYRSYLELMAHWNEVLPGRILRVQHEDVVADLEGSVRRILDFCELPFEPACVQFHKTSRQVHSASSEQVRRPIFKEGLDQWRHYEAWLDPLKRALRGEAGAPRGEEA